MTNIEKLIERMEWQSMDSSPRDGTRILINNSNWSRKDSPEIAAWNEDNNAFYTDDGMKYQADELEYWRHLPTGKEGDIVRVLVKALEKIIAELAYDEKRHNVSEAVYTAQKALAKAEELAGEV